MGGARWEVEDVGGDAECVEAVEGEDGVGKGAQAPVGADEEGNGLVADKAPGLCCDGEVKGVLAG